MGRMSSMLKSVLPCTKALMAFEGCLETGVPCASAVLWGAESWPARMRMSRQKRKNGRIIVCMAKLLGW